MIRIVTLLLILAPLATAQATELDLLRQNLVEYLTAGNMPRGSARMNLALQELEGATRALTAPGYLLSDGSWSDINYRETPNGSWSPWEHTRRLLTMAKAYRTPGQSFYRDPQLFGQIDAALRKVNDFYGTRNLPQGNWWFWTIGIPMDLGPVLILMRGSVDESIVGELTLAIHLRIGNSTFTRGLVGPTPTGQNLVWSAYTHMYLAILRNDASMMAQVREAMASVTLPTAGDGIKSDSSFHQHGAQLYTGGYGGAFANEAARYALIARNTPYMLPKESLHALADFIAGGIAWSVWGNYFDVSVIGREVARRSTTGYHGVAALVQASFFDSPRVAEIRAAAARMLQSWQWGLPPELAGLAAHLENSGTAAAAPAGYRHYPASDFTVYRTQRWHASVKMFSSRTKSGERTNGENRLGARQSDGRFYLVKDGGEYFGRDVLPAMDWSRLPGITVSQHGSAADDTYGYGSRSFAGGAGDGRIGVTAMELDPLNSALFARKSWFFFNDAIVFLTNSITNGTEHPVETIVNQWPLMNPASSLVSGRDWSVLEGVGYYFPTGGNIRTQRETRTGSWSLLGASTDETPYSATFQTIWLDHGSYPNNATAEYVIVPETTPERMRGWVNERPLSILSNTATVSAVRDNRSGAVGIVFWSPGTFDGIQSNGPAVVLIKPLQEGMEIHVSDPAQSSHRLQLSVAGRYTGQNASPGARSTLIDVPPQGGRTLRIVLSDAPPARRRAVR